MQATRQLLIVSLVLGMSLCLVVTGGQAEAALVDGLSAYYSFDTDFSDKSGSGNAGTAVGDAAITATSLLGGGAVALDGNGDWVKSAAGPWHNQDLSWQAWIKTTDTQGGIVAMTNTNWDPGGKGLYIRTTDRIKVDVGWDGQNNWASDLNDDAWHHLVITVANNPSGNEPYTIYVDGGTAAGGQQFNATRNWYKYDATSAGDIQEVRVGYIGIGDGGALSGQVDEVGLWERVLTASEVQQLYNSGAGLDFFATPSTPLFWDGTDGNWTGNWLDDVPGTGSAAGTYPQNIANVINPANITEGTVTVNSDEEAYSLTMDTGTNGAGGRPGNGTLNITSNTLAVNTNATLSNTSTVNISSGATLGVGGTLTIDPTATFNVDGTANVGTLAGTGTATLNTNGKLRANGGSLSTITLTGNAEVEAGGTVTIGQLNLPLNTTITKSGGGTLDITGPTTLQTGQLYKPTAGTLKLSGAVDGSVPLIKNGDGLLWLATNNTYTGQTDITAGRLQINTNDGLGTTAGDTVVRDGAQLRLSGGGLTTPETITINGQGPGNDGALYVQNGGTKTISSLLQTGSESRIHVDDPGSPRLRLTGGFAMDHKVTVATDGSGERLEITTAPITGNGELRKEGNGRIEAKVASPGYSGTVRVTNGYVEAWTTGALGTGQILAEGDGTLLLRNGVTLNNNITISTDGEGTSGAIRSENNTNTLTGTVTSTNNASRIHVNNTQLNLEGQLALNNNVNIYGGGTLNVTGQVTGPGALNKNDAGTTILSNATNSFTGPLKINGGVLQATDPAAIGSASNINVNSGGTLDVLGTATVNNPINANGGSISNSSAGTTLTVAGPINMPLMGDVTFTGAGDTVVTQGFGNGTTPITSNFLNHYGFDRTGDDRNSLYLDSNGGMLNSGSPETYVDFTGQAVLTSGPQGNGLNFDTDADFRGTGAIDQNDNYKNLFIGKLTVAAGQTGDWEFRNSDRDDWTTMWVDLDQDGTFESSTAGLGSNRGEQLAWNDGGTKTVNLPNTGEYLVAFTHLEGGGGSRVEYSFKSPTMSGQAVINPADPAQDGLWSAFKAVAPDNSLIKDGTGTLTLNVKPTYSGDTTVKDGVLEATAGITVNESRQLMLGGGSAFTATTGAFEVANTIDANSPETLTLGGAGTKVTVTTPGTSSGHPTDGLLGMWTFDSETPNDSSGNNNHGTASGGGNPYGPIAYTIDTGNGSSKALDLTGGGDNAVWVDTGGNQDVFDGGNAMTIAAWVKGTPGGWGPLVTKGESGWQMRRHGGNSTLDWTTRGLTSSDWEVPGSGPAIDGEWRFVVMTYDGSKKTAYVYGDDLASPIIESINTTGTITARSDLMVFGARDRDNNPASLDTFFNGYLDDIFFYDKALTAAEVTTLYNGGKAFPQTYSTAKIENLQGSGEIDATNSAGLEVTDSLDIGTDIGQIDVTGDLILGDGITIDWEYSNGAVDRDLVTATGDLELPTTATLNVNNFLGSGILQATEILFEAASFSGATDFTGWTINDAPNYLVSIDGSNLILSMAAVPEPSTLLLMAFGVMGLLAYRRRRKSS